MRKYELDKTDSIIVDGHTLYRVVYTDEFITEYSAETGRTIGKKGGFIESEKNLSPDDYAVVIDDARVFGNAEVWGNTEVNGNTEVSGNVKVYGDAKAFGNAIIRNITICN